MTRKAHAPHASKDPDIRAAGTALRRAARRARARPGNRHTSVRHQEWSNRGLDHGMASPIGSAVRIRDGKPTK